MCSWSWPHSWASLMPTHSIRPTFTECLLYPKHQTGTHKWIRSLTSRSWLSSGETDTSTDHYTAQFDRDSIWGVSEILQSLFSNSLLGHFHRWLISSVMFCPPSFYPGFSFRRSFLLFLLWPDNLFKDSVTIKSNTENLYVQREKWSHTDKWKMRFALVCSGWIPLVKIYFKNI